VHFTPQSTAHLETRQRGAGTTQHYPKPKALRPRLPRRYVVMRSLEESRFESLNLSIFTAADSAEEHDGKSRSSTPQASRTSRNLSSQMAVIAHVLLAFGPCVGRSVFPPSANNKYLLVSRVSCSFKLVLTGQPGHEPLSTPEAHIHPSENIS
jgi:hypothetical protein